MKRFDLDWASNVTPHMEERPDGDYILFASHEADISGLVEALKPFANYACDPPCGCHNCKAKELIRQRGVQ